MVYIGAPNNPRDYGFWGAGVLRKLYPGTYRSIRDKYSGPCVYHDLCGTARLGLSVASWARSDFQQVCQLEGLNRHKDFKHPS